MAAKLSAFVVWALVATCAVFWGMRFTVRPLGMPNYALPTGLEQALHGDVARLFPTKPLAPTAAALPTSSRFQVLGVMAAREPESPQGLALIAVDGKPPRAYHVGAVVEGDVSVQAVTQRSVRLGPKGGTTAFVLDLPALPMPATGQLPSGKSLLPAPG